EGGYADLPATTPLEAEVLALLQARFEHVCWETVLSGPGLVHLYECVAMLWGEEAPPQAVTADWITSAAVDAQHPPCHQALELFLGWLGAAAGNFALTTCAFGGVYLGGGIAPRLAPQLLHGPFRRRFEARGALSALLTDVPVYLILDDSPGLLGALRYARARAAVP
ncbi:MAG: glucokinase, partial [Pseudomonadota bacterium]